MNPELGISPYEPLVPPHDLYDWSRVPPRGRRPEPPAPRLGPKKKCSAKRKEHRFYQLVTRGLA